jgi:hypothetical protein
MASEAANEAPNSDGIFPSSKKRKMDNPEHRVAENQRQNSGNFFDNLRVEVPQEIAKAITHGQVEGLTRNTYEGAVFEYIT